ncbi:hypothetical protein EGW08_012229 [Elysia chlorotica]|uniref:Uncharacterized protein n=1 Tax=Elysia chlorotica TaxID=188477 RepID=A0A3S1BB84_ELYCH|nr:hypothetical protein EGW08_012229 [Elysia chlorotica]
MSLAWLSRGQSRGLLAVGYVNGSLRVLDVAVAWDPVLSITVRETMSDPHCDDLSVAGLDFGVTSQGTEILVACKQCFLFLYTLSDLGSTVKFYKHFEMDVALPLTSVHLRGMFGVASPQESAVVAFEVQESSEISIVQTRQDFTTLSEKVSAPYFSCGATLSPSSALCFSVHKTDFNLQPYRKRHKVLEGQVVAMNIPFSLTPEKMLITLQNPQVTNKDTILNLCLYMKQLLAESKEIETSALDQICHMLKSLMETLGRRGFQVSLALMKFLKLLIQSKSESDWCPEWLPRAYEETLKVSLSQYASETMESSGTLSALSETDQRIISSVERHWSGEVSTPGMLHKDTVVPSSLCLICGSEFLPDTPLTVKCTKGHKANLCCLSCQPCQDLNVRRCETCGASALSLDALSGSMVLQNKSVCPICGSQLVESTWT